MLVVFRQTYKKMVFSMATVVLFLVSMAMFAIFLSGFNTVIQETYFIPKVADATLIAIIFSYFQTFLVFFFPIYVAINSVKFISDEIENGTFLTSLSKPISRFSIILQKFAALMFTNMSFCLGMLAYIWFYALKVTWSAELYDVMFAVLPTMFLVSFVIQLVISIILTIISIRFNSLIMLGVGVGFALLGQLWPQINSGSITKNRLFQNVGTTITKTEFQKIDSGQKLYKKFIRPFSFIDHMNQLYWENVSVAYGKFGLSERAKTTGWVYNQEVIMAKKIVEKRDALNNLVKEEQYYVAKLKPWIENKTLKLFYSIFSVLLAICGIYYFNRKDIV